METALAFVHAAGLAQGCACDGRAAGDTRGDRSIALDPTIAPDGDEVVSRIDMVHDGDTEVVTHTRAKLIPMCKL